MPYPHNIFLELLAETGVVGFLMLVIPVATILDFVRRHWAAVDKRGVAICALYFAAAQVSGDIYDSRALILLPVVAACGAAVRGRHQPAAEGIWEEGRAGRPGLTLR